MHQISHMLTSYVKNKISLSIILFCFFLPACQAVGNAEYKAYLTTAKIKNNSLVLINHQGKCAIKLNNAAQPIALNVPHPCGFVRTRENNPAQTYHYDIGQVFVVAGPLASEAEHIKNPGVKYSYKCSNQGQAVILHKNKLIVRKNREIPLGYCHQLGFDEKDYYGFAYPVE